MKMPYEFANFCLDIIYKNGFDNYIGSIHNKVIIDELADEIKKRDKEIINYKEYILNK